MKEIGEVLRDAREKNGVSKEEAAEDLSLKVTQIESIEAGNLGAFKDVNYLKQFVKDYAKYLGLDADKIMEDFNEFIFDYTSKIQPVKPDKPKKEKKTEEIEIASPYTNINYYKELPPLVYYGVVLILVMIIGYFVYNMFVKGDVTIGMIDGGVVNEFSE